MGSWTLLEAAAWSAAGLWFVVLLLPWLPWWPGPRLEVAGAPKEAPCLDGITVLIPARDEAAGLPAVLQALRAQGQGLRVVVIDDDSSDDTAEVARRLLGGEGCVLRGAVKPPGWSGKLWALEQGRRLVETPWILLLDADIVLRPGLLDAAYRKARAEGLDLLSLMATPRQVGFWERLLMPAFVYFFKLLYPFRISNSRWAGTAAAAGGFVLLRAGLLECIGGFGALRGALIDDCTLARLCKRHGARTWVGLSRDVRSLRRADALAAIRDMVARTAFTQLGYSRTWLGLCTVLMVLAFVVPLAGLWDPRAAVPGTLAWASMSLSYLPTVVYYGRSPLWALLLPAIGILYLWMTWVSALRHWRGQGAGWRGRHYARPDAARRSG